MMLVGEGHGGGTGAPSPTVLVALVLVLAAASCTLAGAGQGDGSRATAYTAHAPIKIIGNDDLTAQNGVTGGTGTRDDPFVISGWEIAPTAGHGIEVLETHGNYIRIRDCKVTGAPAGYAGIRTDFFESITTIEHCALEGNDVGMTFSNSQGITIQDCTLTGNRVGIMPAADASVRVQDCAFSGGATAVHCRGTADSNEVVRCTITAGTTGVVFEGNLGGTVTGSTFPGTPTAVALTSSSKGVKVVGNAFQGQTVAVAVDNSSAVVHGNTFTGLPTAIRVVSNDGKHPDAGQVHTNRFDGCSVGLSFEDGNNWNVYNNSFEDVAKGISISAGTSTVWIDYNDFRGGGTALEVNGGEHIVVHYNNFTGASSYAVSIRQGHSNGVFLNSFQGNNAGGVQAYCDKSDNNWNMTANVLDDKNWWNGLSLPKGNFWGDWHRPDSDRDGFVDAQYAIAGGASSDVRPLSTIPPECGEWKRYSGFCYVDADRTDGPVPLTVDLKAMVVGGIYPFKYYWDFGDGAKAEGFSTSHTYASAGTFTVALTVTGQSDKAFTATKAITTSAVPAPLAASASADRTGGDAPLAVAFTGTATGGTAPYNYAWDFGDGATGTGGTPSHTYAAAGTYSVVLTVADSGGQTKQASALTVTVTSGGGGEPLSASASGDRLSGAAPLTVQFIGVASGGSPPYTYGWTFGDGSTGTGSPVSHTYASDGVYDVVLTVTDSKAATRTAAIITITVGTGGGGNQLIVAASGTPTTGKAPLTVQLLAVASGGTGQLMFEWDFGDGTRGDGGTVSHKFEREGTYTVLVTVMDATGHQRSSTVTVEVQKAPAGDDGDEDGPGFGAMASVVALAVGLRILSRRRR